MENKNIVRVFSQYFNYFAIEKNFIDSIEKWNNQKVIEWLWTIDMQDYVKIF